MYINVTSTCTDDPTIRLARLVEHRLKMTMAATINQKYRGKKVQYSSLAKFIEITYYTHWYIPLKFDRSKQIHHTL